MIDKYYTNTPSETVKKNVETEKFVSLSDSVVTTDSILHKNSLGLFSRSYKYQKKLLDLANEPPECDIYQLFQLFYDDNFTQTEVQFLHARFQEFSRVFGTEELHKGMVTIARRPNITALRDRTFPIFGATKWQHWLDPTIYVAIWMTFRTPLPQCPGAGVSFPFPFYVPGYIRRYEQPQNPDGSWNLGNAPVNRLCETGTFDIGFNATAINNGGLSANTWATAIMHEMLHNMGWEHPAGYRDDTQFIIAVDNLFSSLL